MAYELRFTVPDWEEPQAVDLVECLPLLIGDVDTEYVGQHQEDRETGPEAEEGCRG
jgi:hypothetical protein